LPPLGGMGALHMALDLARQNAVPALFAYGQCVLDYMLEMLACDAALCHGLDYNCNDNLTTCCRLKTTDEN
jgi:hypothetical protein